MPGRLATFAACLFVIALGCGGPTPSASPSTAPVTAAPTSPPPTAPARLFAPYVEMWVGDHIGDIAAASATKHLTLAFLEAIGSASCDLTWNGTTKLSDVAGKQISTEVADLQATGGDVIPSFGGYAADHEGREIADACTDTDAIADSYEGVLDALGVTRLDMDVEVESLDRPDGIDRRNAALKVLQDRFAATGRAVEVQYTLPTSPDGLEANALAVLENAVQHGTRVDIVNLMVFDYYDDVTTDMAKAAISAATGLHGQLATLYPDKTDAELWAMIGLTIMNGVDDYPAKTELTTLDHARTILAFAQQQGLGHLSMWASQRDNGSCPGVGAGDSCSGIEQTDWAFSKILEAFTRD